MRILLPSFRFFDQAGLTPRLQMRPVGGEWIDLLEQPSLPWYGLVFNPRWGLYHALCNAVENLASDGRGEKSPYFLFIRSFVLDRARCECEMRVTDRRGEVLLFTRITP